MLYIILFLLLILIFVFVIIALLRMYFGVEHLENMVLYNKKTIPTSNERGYIFGLSYHNIGCDDNTYLNGVKYVRNLLGLANYVYTCVGDKNVNKGDKLKLSTSEVKSRNSVAQLDKHSISCPSGYALSEFSYNDSVASNSSWSEYKIPGSIYLRAYPNEDHNVSYKYTCIPANNFPYCETNITSYTPSSDDFVYGDQTRSLTGHNIQCQNNQILTSIKMENGQNGTRKGFYYTCCSETPIVNNAVNIVPITGPSIPVSNTSVTGVAGGVTSSTSVTSVSGGASNTGVISSVSGGTSNTSNTSNTSSISNTSNISNTGVISSVFGSTSSTSNTSNISNTGIISSVSGGTSNNNSTSPANNTNNVSSPTSSFSNMFVGTGASGFSMGDIGKFW